MSHYPSSAELASFRRAIRPTWYDRDYTGQDLTGKAWPLAPLDYPPNRVALTYGIGDASRGPEGHLTVMARKRANAIRSRAFREAAPTWPQGHGWHADHFAGACAMERSHGMPAEVSHYRP